MTDALEDIRTWELRPRCLVVVPGLSFEEFAEGPWASIKNTSESVNFWAGDLLVIADREFGDRASQLLDESMTPPRMAQLKWVAEAIPPGRRRDDCSWTMHRLVAGLFNRRRGIFPAAYLDRKAKYQDQILAEAAEKKWHSDSVKARVAALEEEALNSITRRNEPPEGIEPEQVPERATVVDPETKPVDAADAKGGAARTAAVSSSETDPAERDGGFATSLLRMPGDTDTLGRAEEAGGSPAPTTENFAVVAAPDRAELRACIEAVRAAPLVPLADEARIAATLAKPGLDLSNTDRVLTAFTSGWRVKIEQQIDDSGKSRWSVMAMKAGAQRAMGINTVLPYALAEAALAAMLSDMPEEAPAPRPIVTATLALPLVPKHEPLAPPPLAREFDTLLMRAFCPNPDPVRAKLRKWVLHGAVWNEPSPSLGAEADLFIAAWTAATEDDRKPFRKALLNMAEAA